MSLHAGASSGGGSGSGGVTIGAAVTGNTPSTLLYVSSGGLVANSATIPFPLTITPATPGNGLTINGGTITTNLPAFAVNQTINAAGVAFHLNDLTTIDTAHAAGTTLFRVLGGAAGTTVITSVDSGGIILAGAGGLGVPSYSFVSDTGLGMFRVSSGVLGFQLGGLTELVLQNNTLGLRSDGQFAFYSSTLTAGGADTILTRFNTATLHIGSADAATAVAQTLGVQSVSAGHANVAGQPWTFTGSLSNGTGSSGDIIFQTGATGTASGTQNALNTALTIKGGTAQGIAGSVVFGSGALSSAATDGFIYIAAGAGAPSGTATAFTGSVPMYIDTTNSQMWLYLGGAWKQPKTPTGAAIVTWQ